jgi:hypothetical protein
LEGASCLGASVIVLVALKITDALLKGVACPQISHFSPSIVTMIWLHLLVVLIVHSSMVIMIWILQIFATSLIQLLILELNMLLTVMICLTTPKVYMIVSQSLELLRSLLLDSSLFS